MIEIGLTTTNAGLTYNTSTSTLTATNYAGNGSALSGKQSTINSTAGQLIIGNGNGSTTTSSSLTFSGTTLTATNINASNSLTVNGVSIFAYTELINGGSITYVNEQNGSNHIIDLNYNSTYHQKILIFTNSSKLILAINLNKSNGGDNTLNYSQPYAYSDSYNYYQPIPESSRFRAQFFRYTTTFIVVKNYHL